MEVGPILILVKDYIPTWAMRSMDLIGIIARRINNGIAGIPMGEWNLKTQP
jgi:hypothetical protein